MTAAATVTPADVRSLVDELQATLERAAEAQDQAITLCERVTNAAEALVLTEDSAWGFVTLEVACVRDVLPGGQSEGDPLDSFGLVRDLVELAARRSE